MLRCPRKTKIKMPCSSLAPIRVGDRSQQVLILQKGLRNAGLQVNSTGFFDGQTNFAVRNWQQRNGWFPDGIATQEMLDALAGDRKSGMNPPPDHDFRGFGFLGSVPTSQWNMTCLGGQAYPPASMSVSGLGKNFILRLETGGVPSLTDHLHFPGGLSGVTLGPGYDMKKRSEDDISQQMTAIGVDVKTALEISSASGLEGDDAKKFARDNKDLVNLSDAQQIQLLDTYLPKYSTDVRRQVHTPLLQCEFDALVSFAVNSAGNLGRVAQSIRLGEVKEAMTWILRSVGSNMSVKGGLMHRRQKEIRLYLYGQYSA